MVNKRISDWLDYKHKNGREASDYLGISSQNISKLRKGEKQASEKTILLFVEKYPDLNLNWLFTGEDNMLKKSDSEEENSKLGQNEDVIGLLQKEIEEIRNDKQALQEQLKSKDDQINGLIQVLGSQQASKEAS